MIDLTKVIATLGEASKNASHVADLAKTFGLPDSVVKAAEYAAAVSAVALAVKRAIDDGKVVMSGDPVKSKEILTAIANVNDGLAAQIAAS